MAIRVSGIAAGSDKFTPNFPAAAQRCTDHFYRNVFSHVPKALVCEVVHMLKAIQSQPSRDTTIDNADAAVSNLPAKRLSKAADLVENKVQETIS